MIECNNPECNEIAAVNVPGEGDFCKKCHEAMTPSIDDDDSENILYIDEDEAEEGAADK